MRSFRSTKVILIVMKCGAACKCRGHANRRLNTHTPSQVPRNTRHHTKYSDKQNIFQHSSLKQKAKVLLPGNEILMQLGTTNSYENFTFSIGY